MAFWDDMRAVQKQIQDELWVEARLERTTRTGDDAELGRKGTVSTKRISCKAKFKPRKVEDENGAKGNEGVVKLNVKPELDDIVVLNGERWKVTAFQEKAPDGIASQWKAEVCK